MKTLDHMHFGLFTIVCCLLLGCKSEITERNESSSIGTNYFISQEGDDNNPGAIEQPWKTIEKLNQFNLSPGDSVLFKGEQIFTGTIYLDSNDLANQKNRIVITSYGSGRMIIDGINSAGLIINNTSNLIVKNLAFKGSGRKEGNNSDGVLIENCKNLKVDSLEIYGFQHSGQQITKSQNAKITNVYAHDNGFAGIHVSGGTINDPVNYDNKNIYIGYCVAENNPGDPTITDNHSGNGILVSSVNGGTIEYCEAFNNGWDMPWDGNGPVGIWIWDSNDFVIQYCIAHHNKTAPGAHDGGGFDFDGGVSNSILQYCFSFNNGGPGIGLFEFGATKPWENNTLRYNLSLFCTRSVRKTKNRNET